MSRVMVFGSSGNLGRAVREEARKLGWAFMGGCRNPEFGDEIRLFGSGEVDAGEVKRFGPFDLVVFAQGVQRRMLLEEVSPVSGAFDILSSNLVSPLYATTRMVREKMLNPGALMIYCSSIQAVAPRRGRVVYAVAKAGLEALARAVVAETNGEVRAVALRLGQFEHTMKGVQFSPDEEAALRARVPAGFVPEDEIAKFIFALYDTPHITGCVIDFEGGHLLNIWP